MFVVCTKHRGRPKKAIEGIEEDGAEAGAKGSTEDTGEEAAE